MNAIRALCTLFGFAGATAAALSQAGCKACSEKDDPSRDGTPVDITPALAPATLVPPPDAGPRIKPTCGEATASLALPEGLYGGGAIAAGALFVGATSASKPPQHGFVRAPTSLASSRFVEIASARGDEPPPEIAADGSTIWVAAYAGLDSPSASLRSGLDSPSASLRSGMKPRRLAVARIDAAQGELAAKVAPQETFAVDEDESYGFGIAAREGRVVVVWDGEQNGHGVIFARVLGAASNPGAGASADAGIAGFVLSGSEENAFAPKIVATARGFFVAWLAERAPVAGIADGGASAVEGPGERAAYFSLSGARLDESGARGSTPPVLLGSPESEVVGFDLASSAFGVSVVAVDRRVRGNTASTRLFHFPITLQPWAVQKAEEWFPASVGNAGVTALGDITIFADDRERAMVAQNGLTRAEPTLDGTSVVAKEGATLFVLRTRPRDGGVERGIALERAPCPSP